MSKPTQYPKTVDELPRGEIFAILKPTSVTTTENWGPPDPPNQQVTYDYWNIEVYPDRASWEAEIHKLSSRITYHREPFKAVIMRAVEIRTQIVVDVDPKS